MRFTSFVAAGALLVSPVAFATTITQLTSGSQLSPTDTHFVPAGAVGMVYGGPSVSFASPSGTISFSRGSGGYEIDQAGYTYGGTAFSNGTILVGAGGFQGNGDGGAITLTFANPVNEFGLNIEDFDEASYDVAFTAFDVMGASLGTYQALGNDPLGGGPSLLSFEGLAVSGDSIARVVFDDSAAGGSNNLIFGNIAYGSPAVTPVAATPEPSSLALLGTGLLGAVGVMRKRFAQ